jgi:uncharacterized membrane protein
VFQTVPVVNVSVLLLVFVRLRHCHSVYALSSCFREQLFFDFTKLLFVELCMCRKGLTVFALNWNFIKNNTLNDLVTRVCCHRTGLQIRVVNEVSFIIHLHLLLRLEKVSKQLHFNFLRLLLVHLLTFDCTFDSLCQFVLVGVALLFNFRVQ